MWSPYREIPGLCDFAYNLVYNLDLEYPEIQKEICCSVAVLKQKCTSRIACRVFFLAHIRISDLIIFTE